MSKHTCIGMKVILKGWRSCSFVNFGPVPCSWIWIRIPNTDPDPVELKNSESGSATLGLSMGLDPDEHRSAFCSEN
jgi:hypothetical protein